MKKLFFFCALWCSIAITSCDRDFLPFAEEIAEADSPLVKRTCDSEEHQHKLMENIEYKINFEKRLEKTDRILKTRSNGDCENTLILPVAVHFQDVGNIDQACLSDLAQRQIDILNNDFSGSNNDISKWSFVKSNYPGVEAGDACIQFCIATKNHPSGFGLSEGQKAVTVNKTSGDFVSEWAGYINIYVQYDLGYLGYAPLGGTGDGDGVVVDANAFGAGTGCGNVNPQGPFNLGRTLTHEMGHYLLLDHLWGDGGCGSTDNVADTPVQADANYDCPSANTAQCGSKDLHMSYMDYSNDACMYMFSRGQSARMNSYTLANLQNIISKGGQVCGELTDNDGNGGDQTSSCEPVSQFLVKDKTTTSISLEWSASASSKTYQIAIQKVGSSGWTQKSLSKENYTFQNLIEGTEYRIRVRLICSSSSSTWKVLTVSTNKQNEEEEDDGCPGFGFTLNIGLDDYPEETEWTIKDKIDGTVLYSGGSFTEAQIGREVSTDFCLENGCYVIEVSDTYGDGICCDYGEGYFNLLAEDGEVVYSSDGNFGSSDQIFLCVKADGKLQVSSETTIKKDTIAKKSRRR